MAHLYNSQLDAFSIYHQQQSQGSTSTLTTEALPALGHALSGATGTAIANLAIYPLDLIITRLQVQRQLRKSSSSTTPQDSERYDGLIDAAQKIYEKEGGLKAFYAGVLPDTGKSITDAFLFFLFYNFLRQRRLRSNGTAATTLPAIDELAVGAAAGAASRFFTTPIGNIVTRMQTASMTDQSSSSDSSTSKSGITQTAQKIHSEKGLQGFWSGYSASLVLTLNPSLTFFLYETSKRLLLPREKRDNPSPQVTFLLAALSKAIASTITYPFSLAKARAQVEAKKPSSSLPEADSLRDIKNEAVDAAKEKDKQTAKDAAKKAQAATRQALNATVFATILRIYKDEGLSALYEGVWGEILKGFFSHGVTMLVKESIHSGIIKLYFLVLRLLNRAPPLPTAEQVKDQAQAVYGQAVAGANQTVNSVVEGARDVYGKVVVAGAQGVEGVREGGELAKEQAAGLLGNAQEQVGGSIEVAGKKIKAGGK